MVWLELQSGRQQLIITFFYMELFTAAPVEYDEVLDCVPQTISNEQNSDLNKELTREEVKTALFQMHPDKAQARME